MKKYILLVPFLMVLLMFQSACTKKDKIPGFLRINNFTLEANPNLVGTEGELTSNFTDVWVYADGQIIGVFELPCEVPLLLEGAHEITLIPGVKNNGISATKGRYLMCKSHIQTIDVVPNETIEINPVTSYKDEVNFYRENFEGPTNTFVNTEVSVAELEKSSDGAVYGGYCGRVVINTQDSVWSAKTDWNANLPKGQDVYMELDYAIEHNILISTEAGNSGGTSHSPYLELQGSTSTGTQWKKMYVTLKENVSFEINATFYNIVMTSVVPTDGSERVLLIDNVKLVYVP
jgi:hypothetical protein